VLITRDWLSIVCLVGSRAVGVRVIFCPLIRVTSLGDGFVLQQLVLGNVTEKEKFIQVDQFM
jgi:hypothetical protein